MKRITKKTGENEKVTLLIFRCSRLQLFNMHHQINFAVQMNARVAGSNCYGRTKSHMTENGQSVKTFFFSECLQTKGAFLVLSVNYKHQFTYIRCLVTTAVIGHALITCSKPDQSPSAGTGIMIINEPWFID